MKSFARACLALLALMVAGTASAGSFTTKASWYGSKFHGKRMANGELFDKNDPENAAHRTLPLGSILLVRNVENGVGCVVVVKDRGPYVQGRGLDVSSAAAEILGFKEEGTTTLVVTVLYKPTQNVLGGSRYDA